MASIGKKGCCDSGRKKERVFELVIIEDSIDDLSERRLQFLSRSEAFSAIQETVETWLRYDWNIKLPPMPCYEQFLDCLTTKRKIVYEAGSIGHDGFHLEIKVAP